MDDFVMWLQSELASRGWSRSEAARRGGISASMMDKVINRYANPGIKFCLGIARAFGLPQDEVLRRAGLLRPTWQQIASEDFTIGEIVDAVRQMDKAERLELLRYARYRQSLSKSDESGEPSNKSKRLNRVEPDAQ